MASPYQELACAHCQARRATGHECDGCGKSVCADCAADPTTCPRPAARVARLGRLARLRAVDPDGVHAAVSSWRGKLRLWSIAERRYLDGTPKAPWLLAAVDPSRVLCRCGRHALSWRDSDVMIRGRELAAVMPRKVISSLGFDCEGQLLAAASFDQLEVFRRRGDRVERISGVRVAGEEVRALAVGLDRIVALTTSGRRGRLRAYRCSSDTFHPLPFYEHIGGDHPELRFRPFGDSPDAGPGASGGEPRQMWVQLEPIGMSMAGDGRFVAVACADSRVVVHDLAAGAAQTHGDHRGGISALAIVDGGRLLVSGDGEGRIIARERGARGYSRWLITPPR